MRQLNAHRFTIEEFHFDLQVGNQVIHRVTQNFPAQMGLLEIGGVHEVVAVSIRVEELHLNFIDVDLLDGIGRTEAVFEHGARPQVAQFCLNEGAQVARSAVLDAENRMQIVVVLDDHAGAKLGGGDSHCWVSLLEKLLRDAD